MYNRKININLVVTNITLNTSHRVR